MPGRSGTGWPDEAPVDRGGSRLVSGGSVRRARRAGGSLRTRLGHRLAGQRQSAARSGVALARAARRAFHRPRPDEVGSRYAGHTWKLPSIQRFGAYRPLAWIDDELHGDAYAWAAMRRIPTKLLTTDPSRGITDRHVRALLAFARCTSAGGRKPANLSGPVLGSVRSRKYSVRRGQLARDDCVRARSRIRHPQAACAPWSERQARAACCATSLRAERQSALRPSGTYGARQSGERTRGRCRRPRASRCRWSARVLGLGS